MIISVISPIVIAAALPFFHLLGTAATAWQAIAIIEGDELYSRRALVNPFSVRCSFGAQNELVSPNAGRAEKIQKKGPLKAALIESSFCV